MKRSLVAVAAALFVSLAALNVSAQTTPVKAVPKGEAAFFPLEDVRPGQKGTGRTVFQGSETEEFGVEILGVLQGFPAPRQSAIIARLTGKNVEKTRVFGGMSGSPVFIDGKLVGAVAFAFPFAEDPIAGITPIQQMVDIFERGRVTRRATETTCTHSYTQ